MKTPKALINNIIGQLNGVARMLEDDRDCLEILIQLKAARSALDSLASRLIESDLLRCAQAGPDQAAKIKKLIKELNKQ